jgi:predicted peptidase
MGGYGSWTLLAENPDYWAAAIPICGGGKPETAPKFKHVPIWVFHGTEDQAVKLKLSEDMVAALKSAGGEPKFTVYKGVGHDSWTAAYADAETWKWLFAQTRKPTDTP